MQELIHRSGIMILFLFQFQGFKKAGYCCLNTRIFGPRDFIHAIHFIQAHLQRKMQEEIKKSKERINLIFIKIHERVILPPCYKSYVYFHIFYSYHKVSGGMMPGIYVIEVCEIIIKGEDFGSLF